MFGLYNRAEIIRREEKLSRLINREMAPSQDDFGISVREEEEVLDHLESIAYRGSGVSNKAFTFNARKNDIKFPIIANLLIIAAVVSAVFIFAGFSSSEEKSITSGSENLYSTEGNLLQKLREESEIQLQQKEDEITATRQKLTEIDNERSVLVDTMEDRIRARENELTAQLEKMLEDERQRLLAENLSSESIENRLKEIETAGREEYKTQLDAYASQLEEEKKLNEDRLNSIRAELEQQLKEIENGKETLLAELDRERSTSTDNRAAADTLSRQYEQLRMNQQEDTIITDQIQSFYRQISGKLDGGKPEEALPILDNLEDFLSDEAIASWVVVRERHDLDQFMISSIKTLIGRTAVENASTEVREPQPTGDLSEIAGLINEADILYSRGDIISASDKYIEAFNKIPMLKQGYEHLKSIDEAALKSEIDSLNVKLQQTEEVVSTEKQNQSRLENSISRLSSRVNDLQMTRDRSNQILSRINEAEKIYRAEGVKTGSSISSRNELLNLLEAKLVLKEIIVSESVSEAYPELYENIEEYFEKYGEGKKLEGEYSTMKDVISFITVLSEPGSDIEKSIQSSPDTIQGNALYVELLEKLRDLIEREG